MRVAKSNDCFLIVMLFYVTKSVRVVRMNISNICAQSRLSLLPCFVIRYVCDNTDMLSAAGHGLGKRSCTAPLPNMKLSWLP